MEAEQETAKVKAKRVKAKREYEITREEPDSSTVYNLPPIKEHEFLIGVFLPRDGICNDQGIVGHTVIWYMHQNNKCVLSFTPKIEPNQPPTPWKNTCCRVTGEYEDTTKVHNNYVSKDLYKKLLYKITYTDEKNGKNKIGELYTIHQEYMKEETKYKGLSTALCCYPKHNCTTIITSLLPGLGLHSDLNHPFSILLSNLIIILCTAYLVVLFDQIEFNQKSKTTYEYVSVIFAGIGISLNALYFLYRVSVLFFRENWNNLLFGLSYFRKGARDALKREYLNQRLLAILNLIFSIISGTFSLLDCTCPKKRYLRGQGAIFAITLSAGIVIMCFSLFKLVCISCRRDGVKNPYSLRDVLDRASVPKKASNLASTDEAKTPSENNMVVDLNSQDNVENLRKIIDEHDV